MHHQLKRVRTALMFSMFSGLLAACGANEAAAPATAKAMPPMEVEVIAVSKTALNRTVQLPGRVQSVRTAQVRARVEGILEQRVYTEGSDVKAGDILFRIDPAVMAANVAVAKATVAEKQADAQVAEQTLSRMRALLATHAISSQQFDEASARKSQTDAAVAAAQAALTRIQIDLDRTTVRAPISGRIGRAMVTEGALVGEDDATHLATIEQVNPIQVNFAQSSADYLRFRQQIFGEKATSAANPVRQEIRVNLLLEDGSSYSLAGKMLWADFSVDINTGSVFMRAEFPNPEGSLLPGQFVGIRLPFAATENSITVPQRAVMASAEGQYVYRVTEGNAVEPVVIDVGGLSGTNWIVRNGLNEGDKIIVNGLQKVRPGAIVAPVLLAEAKPEAAAGADKRENSATPEGQ